VIVGDDPWDAFPDYLAQVRAARDVVHVPWHENAPGLMRHFDVLVAPSHQEPFGTVISEAMAVGTPVVATRVGGLAEVVDDGVTGMLVEPGRARRAGRRGARGPRAARRDERRGAPGGRRFGADAYADRVEALIRPVTEARQCAS
jgi:starch synthase